MKVLSLVTPKTQENVVSDVLYGAWCSGRFIAGATVPPLSLLSVSTVLKEYGFDVILIDAQAQMKSVHQLESIIKDFKVVLILTSTMTLNNDNRILRLLKTANPKLLSIVFGSHPTYMPDMTLKRTCIDIVVRKEPEYIIRDLLIAIRENKSWEHINGIAYRKNGNVQINPDYQFIMNLDELPIPDRSLLSRGVKYFNPAVKRNPYTTALTSRGCPSRCTFCTANTFFGNHLRAISAKRVLEEINILLRDGYREIYYRDEIFTSFKKRNLEIFENIIKSRLDFTWLCNGFANSLLDYDTLKLMKHAGCHTIKLGIESGVQEILDKCKKGIRLDDVDRICKHAKRAGINIHAHMMFGMPGETRETMERTIRYIRKIKPTSVTYGICTPYPGTELFEEVKNRVPEIGDGTGIDLNNLHKTTFFNEYFSSVTEEDIRYYVKRAYRKFYLDYVYILRWLFRIRSFDEFRRLFKAGANLIYFSIKGR